jgi:hypothetical protein
VTDDGPRRFRRSRAGRRVVLPRVTLTPAIPYISPVTAIEPDDDPADGDTGDDNPYDDDRPLPREVYERLAYYEELTVFHVPLIHWPVSANKVHAAVYGLVGYYVGGLTTLAPLFGVSLAVALNLLALGVWIIPDHRVTAIGLKTIKYKPHYYLIPFLCAFEFGRRVLFAVAVSL